MLKINNLNFTYSEEKKSNILNNINLHIKKGEVILLCGESGSGKTTITRLINGLIPNFYSGKVDGNITLIDENIFEIPIYKIAEKIGSVFQNPKTQFFNVDTTSELAFGCENLGLPIKEIEKRINEIVYDFQIEHLLNKSIFKLSGGEKQKIACASISACFPEILILDEPSSNLDSTATWDLREMIISWKNMGKTVIIAEHRIYFLKDIIDRMIYMKDGKIQRIISNEEIKTMQDNSFSNLGIRTLSLTNLTKNKNNIFNEINNHEKEDNYNNNNNKKDINKSDSSKKNSLHNPYFSLKDFKFSYENELAINIDSAKIPQNEIIAIIGKNGAGKSTFARCLCGLERKCKGKLKVNGKNLNSRNRLKISYMVMQDVNYQLFTESVLDEIYLSLDDFISKNEITCNEKKEIAEDILKNLDLLEFKDAHPMALSGGQKQRIVIGSAIASNKEIMIFDEPTSGLDLKHMREVANNIKNLQKRGISSFIISHDLELIFECCNYVIHLEEGKIIDKYYIDHEGERKLKNFFIQSD